MPRWLLAVILAIFACAPGEPMLADDLPADLAEVVSAGLARVEEALPAQRRCLEGVVVSHSWDLDDRAEYWPATATIVLRVPATAPNLEFSLVHEIAHHLESSCRSQEELRPAFLAAQGFPPGVDWSSGESWQDTPSEHFATALAEYVTGRPEPQRPIPLTEETRVLVAAWATDGVTHGTSAP